MIWYPFYAGDYARDTAHLSMLEHGAYRLLLDHYYNTQAPLPLDRGKLYRVCRAIDGGEREAIDAILESFFLSDLDGWRNKKADLVIEQQAKKAEVNRERALKAVEGKRSKGNAPSSTPSSSPSSTPSEPNQNQNQNQNSEVKEPQPQPKPKPEKPVVVADENPLPLEELADLYRFYHGPPNVQQQCSLLEIAENFTSEAIVKALEASEGQANKNPAAWVKICLESKSWSYLPGKDPTFAFLDKESTIKPPGYFAGDFVDKSDQW